MSDDLDRLDRAADVNAELREVVIADGVVRRPATESTVTVHAFLHHLRGQGLDCVPEPLGVDDGVESLRLLEGDAGGDR